MAKMKNGILGGLSGTIGTVVGGTWRGINYLRSKSTRTNFIATAKQEVQQAKFRLVANFLSSMNGLLSFSFQELAINQTGRNYAHHYNITEAVTGTYPDFELDYSKVRVSGGSLKQPVTAQVEAGTEGTIHFSWDDIYDQGATGLSDRAVLIVHCPSIMRTVYTFGAVRTAGTSSFQTPFRGKDVHTWIAFISESLKKVSRSMYTGAVTLD